MLIGQRTELVKTKIYLTAGCDVRIESVTSCSGAMPRLSPFTLLFVPFCSVHVWHVVSGVKGASLQHTHTLLVLSMLSFIL